MNKKGFTLIELLAVIVVLAVIAIISVPIITDLINKSRYGAFGSSKKNIERAAELYHTRNADDLVWQDDISYVTIGTLKAKKYLRNNVVNTLDSTSISDDTKVLIYRSGRRVDYSLQLYDNQFFDWYQKEMVAAVKNNNLIDAEVDLEDLITKYGVADLRVKNNMQMRCIGYVKVEQNNGTYEYTPFLDCGDGNNILVDSSYVNFGGNYLDDFSSVKKTSDGGFVAVGRSNSTNFKEVIKSTIDYDGLIVKFTPAGEIEWHNTFGGSEHDYFYDVIENNDSYVVVGEAISTDGDLAGLSTDVYKSIIVNYNKSGSLKSKKILFKHPTTWGSAAYSILTHNNDYYIGGASRVVDGSYVHRMFVAKLDESFNIVWEKGYGGTDYASYNGRIAISNNKLILIGDSRSTNGELADIKIGPVLDTDAVIFELDMNNGSIISKGIFGGATGDETFNDVIIVNDGYIAVGHSRSNDHDMEGIHKGNTDAIIVKLSNVPDANGVLPIIYKKSFGGSSDDIFKKIIQDGNSLVVAGISKSIDGDLLKLTKAGNGNYDGIIVKYDMNGNLITKTTYGGSGSENISSIIKDDNNYVIVGSTFSLDKDINSFNKGNSDAILAKMDSNLNLIKQFKLPALLMDKPKELVVNYGTSIPTPANKNNLKLYTTNDATRDLESWCARYVDSDPNGNYKYISCIKPFDEGNINRLVEKEKILAINSKNINPSSLNTWIKVSISFSWAGGDIHEISNFKLKFQDEQPVTVSEAVNLGYIAPLIVSGHDSTINYCFHNSFDIIGGSPIDGNGRNPNITLIFKQKNKLLETVSFNSKTTPDITKAGYTIDEFKNFDISITKAD